MIMHIISPLNINTRTLSSQPANQPFSTQAYTCQWDSRSPYILHRASQIKYVQRELEITNTNKKSLQSVSFTAPSSSWCNGILHVQVNKTDVATSHEKFQFSFFLFFFNKKVKSHISVHQPPILPYLKCDDSLV